jgi:hypothetical protein
MGFYEDSLNRAETMLMDLRVQHAELLHALKRMVESYEYEASSENESLLNAKAVIAKYA